MLPYCCARWVNEHDDFSLHSRNHSCRALIENVCILLGGLSLREKTSRRERGTHDELEAGGTREPESEPVKFIRKIIYRSGILRDVQPRREMERERDRMKETHEWLIFGARGRSPTSRGLKNVFAFDLYPVPEVADAQTSSGTSRIVLAPSAALVQGYFLPRAEDTKPTRHPAYNLCRNFIHVISRDPSRACSCYER